MIADQRQRAEALDPARSFIVEAPAGSGKTGILVQRFLRLLSIVERPESVVAMTFTRKAAAEMKKRILDALADASRPAIPEADEFKRKTRDLATAVLTQDQSRNWNLREDPSRLQIQTIDSLCALLTRQMPILSEFGGFGEVIEEASELYLRAARQMLTSLAEGDPESQALFRRMVLHFDNDVKKLEGQIVRMLGKRDQWEHLNPCSNHQLVQDCCAVLQHAEEQLRMVFQRAGKVDFTESARAARRALGGPDRPSDLLYSLDYRLQHLLVDEFQDTSRSQYELVKALTEQWSLGDDHTLFLVGDPMQSIYRFREADVGLFLKCWQERRIGAVQVTPLVLHTNFRSTANILKWVETHCAPMMPDDNRDTGAVKFRRSSSGRQTKGTVPHVIAHIDDQGAEEAEQIVEIIRRNPGRTVAILVRSRPQTTHILPALRKAGIACEAIDIEMLRDQQHIIDLLSLTRALTNLADRVSWLACLRAPWSGLTLADLSALAEGKRDQTILDLLSDPATIQTLSVDGRWRAVRLQEILSTAVTQVGRLPLRQLVEQTWQALGGLAATQETNQREDIATLLRLIEESDEGGIIRDFSLLNQKLEFLYARPAVTGSGVVVMTIFQAKGLEFDIVILPQLGRKVRSYENELLLWTEREGTDGLTELAIAAMPQTGVEDPDYKNIADIAKLRDDNESRRLFYVACTRAIDELHLIGSVSTKQDGAQCKTPSSGTFLRLLWESQDVQDEFTGKLRRQMTTQQTSFAFPAPLNKILLRRLPADWRAPVLAANIRMEEPIRHAVASQRQVSYRWVGDTSRHAGTMVHDLLKRIAAEGLEHLTAARVFALSQLVDSELLRLGVPMGNENAATKQVLRAVTNTIRSPRGRWILSAHAEARSEWAIAGRINNLLVSGTVDRAFSDEEGNFRVIDFKNSQHSGGSLDNFLANEKQRYQPQLEQYAAVISRLVNAPVILGLYFPLHDAWLEWQFDEKVIAGTAP
jgi:ATP-dependent helicase/nuclease subunit A